VAGGKLKLKPLSVNDQTINDILVVFTDEIHEMEINEDDILVSYHDDVSSLSTNVPVDETIESIIE